MLHALTCMKDRPVGRALALQHERGKGRREIERVLTPPLTRLASHRAAQRLALTPRIKRAAERAFVTGRRNLSEFQPKRLLLAMLRISFEPIFHIAASESCCLGGAGREKICRRSTFTAR
jgi:hypothetical protein